MTSEGHCEVDFGDASDDADPVEFYNVETIKAARKAHVCDECGGVIAKGESYQRKAYRFEGDFHSERICAACQEVAGEFDHRLCGGMLWETFAEEWANGAHLQSCLNRLTSVRAKETMRQQWTKWNERRMEQEQQRRERLRQIREERARAPHQP